MFQRTVAYYTEQDVSPSRNDQADNIRIDTPCVSFHSPLFIHIENRTHLEISIPTKAKMVDATASEEIPIEGQTADLERISPRNHTSDGPKSEGAIFKEPTVAAATPIAPFIAPNGGLKAWSAVLGGFLCQFASFGFLNV